MDGSPENIVKQFIQEFCPNCKLALLAGSAYRNELNSKSDLDVVIIDETKESSYRECFFYLGWYIEAFVFHSRYSIEFAFEIAAVEGLPTIQRMCTESIPVIDDGTVKQLQKEASLSLDRGPYEWTNNEKDHARFMITDLLNDLQASISQEEQLFIASKLFEIVNEFILRANGHWIGYGKWMFRSLYKIEPVWTSQWVKIYTEYLSTRNIDPLNKFIEQALDPFGGKLFEGFKEELL